MRDAGRAVWASLPGKAFLVVAGAILGVVGWLLFALLYAWPFEVDMGWFVWPYAVVAAGAAAFARERQLRPLAGGIFLGPLFPILLFLWVIETTGG